MERPVCAITGATGGIGRAIALRAAIGGYNLVLHGRSSSKLSSLADDVRVRFPDLAIESVSGDLGTVSGAKIVAARILNYAPELDLLFNNAGVLLDGIQMSRDELEMHTQVNLIAPYILMQTLRPGLSLTGGSVINVASGAVLRAREFSVDSLKRPKKAKKLFGAYANSKLALAIMTAALSEEFDRDGIRVAAVDPGPNRTSMTAGNGMPWFLKLLQPIFYSTPERGAARLFESVELSEAHAPGTYFHKGRAVRLPKHARKAELENAVLAFCENVVAFGN
ncbi:MAG: SDR family NAD(P)-dependent oxidoreductase [Gammaproteobacteria bacterium]|nr:SDR family NAD(P)-dependent oxidoreductase [Gammaproteobacteria bacterium]